MKAKQIILGFLGSSTMQIMALLQKRGRPENHLETNIKQQIANITLAK